MSCGRENEGKEGKRGGDDWIKGEEVIGEERGKVERKGREGKK